MLGDDGDSGSRGGLGAAGSGVSSLTRTSERLMCFRIKREEMYSNASVCCEGSAFAFTFGVGATPTGPEMRDFWMAILTVWVFPCGGSSLRAGVKEIVKTPWMTRGTIQTKYPK